MGNFVAGRDKLGLGRKSFEASRPWDVEIVKPMANPAIVAQVALNFVM